ncbi:RE1-silencing transcription factor-like isoform X3 [Sinocyclocheilus grahami]|uniref:RE1-silencing transcription factor-like isoform X1 n=1 Tax=Sinocyclocheilus grahami TaxID=75366 RepID=UPI0007AD57BA|nr:PREDICTED: RE1-silencing transcription factor-like isoform X1 [Sinocyclocheilus grahami]XP_016130156.1 PREDICTED: RE1-silencing transcription factor-like isoform X2 [Sinocyclocheilus grahami]XP_016130157.1 PREDICTED: RE1-silencing transcription factor-like isoform X3 [Sinocyclocheilus grahami]
MSAQTVYPAAAGIFMPVGIPLPEVGHDLPELPRNNVAAPQLVMLANVVVSSEASSSDYNAEEKQMVELKTVGCNSYSDSEEEGVIKYSLDNSEMSESTYAEHATRVEPEMTERVIEQVEMERADPSEKTPSESSPAEKRKRTPVVVFESNKKKKKPFFCKPCQYQAENEEDFIHHIRVHGAKKMTVVNGMADSDDDLASESGQSQTPNPENSESLSNSKGVIRCERCGYNTNRYDHYMAHLKHHTKEGEDQRVFKCTICAYTTISQYHWKKHLRNHFPSKLFTCNQCSYFSDRKNNYIQHIRTHTGERPFQCIYCDYSSSQKTHLTRHMRTHSGERPFKCDNCSYLAANQHEVTRHARQVHNGPKPLSCPYCQYKTADRSNFKKHVELHVNPRQFLCTVCKYAASKKCNLQYHIKSRHPGCTDISMDVSKVRLRVKRTDTDDISPNKLATDQSGSRRSEDKQLGELDDVESGPINLSIKKPTKPTLAVETELTGKTAKKNPDVIVKEKSGKPTQQLNEKTAEKKNMPKNEVKEKNSKKVKGKTLVKAVDIAVAQTKGCNDKQANKKEMKKVEKSPKSVEKVAKGRPKKEKPLKETANEVTAKHQPIVEQRLDMDKERPENDLEKQQQQNEKEKRERLEKENSLLNGKAKETEEKERAKDCKKPQPKKPCKRQTKLSKVNREKDTQSKPVKRKAENMKVPATDSSVTNCPSKRVKRTTKDTAKPSTSSGAPERNRTIPEVLQAVKSKTKNAEANANKPETCVIEPEKTNEVPEKLNTLEAEKQSTTETLKVLDQPDEQTPTVVTCQDERNHKETASVVEELTVPCQPQVPDSEQPKETENKVPHEPKEIPDVDSGSEMPSPTDNKTSPGFSPTLELPGPPGHKSTDAEDDEGIHSNDGGSDISDSASEGSCDSGLNGLTAATDGREKLPETPTEELPSPSKLLSHTCIFCDRTFSLEMDYRRHLNRHLVNVYYLEGAAQGDK